MVGQHTNRITTTLQAVPIIKLVASFWLLGKSYYPITVFAGIELDKIKFPNRRNTTKRRPLPLNEVEKTGTVCNQRNTKYGAPVYPFRNLAAE